jgi:hypothetical protein
LLESKAGRREELQELQEFRSCRMDESKAEFRNPEFRRQERVAGVQEKKTWSYE